MKKTFKGIVLTIVAYALVNVAYAATSYTTLPDKRILVVNTVQNNGKNYYLSSTILSYGSPYPSVPTMPVTSPPAAPQVSVTKVVTPVTVSSSCVGGKSNSKCGK